MNNLARDGRQLKRVPGNGQCFLSVVDQLIQRGSPISSTAQYADILRHFVAEHLQRNPLVVSKSSFMINTVGTTFIRSISGVSEHGEELCPKPYSLANNQDKMSVSTLFYFDNIHDQPITLITTFPVYSLVLMHMP